MKTYMPLNGLRWSRNSGSANCDMPQSAVFGRPGGGKMSFTFLFYKHIMFRKSCGYCHFTNTKRPSDITIADFWGWEKTDKNFNADNKGCSLVLLNTEKGRKLFVSVKDRMNTFSANLDDCLQPNMMRPSEIHPRREKFEEEYAKKGFMWVT